MTKKQKKMRKRIMITIAIIVVLVCLELCLGSLGIFTTYFSLLYLIPYFIIGYDILRKAAKGIYHRQVFDENFLMAVATVGAILLGEMEEGVAVMLFYQIGELFQSYAVGKSRRNISGLMDIRPDVAYVETSEGIIGVDPEEVAPGTILVVRPGEKIPMDGVVVEGVATLDTAALTGESMPREASVGEPVISGSINLKGVIRMETTKAFGESTVAKILDLVENATSKKSKPEQFISKFARYYTPAVCYGALALMVAPPLVRLVLGLAPLWPVWVYRGLTFLVISCPCALVISIPLSFFAGMGCASSHGILIKGSNYLEALSRAKYVVFDKTGTLTKGCFEVVDVQPVGGDGAGVASEDASVATGVAGTSVSGQTGVAMGQMTETQMSLLEYAAHAEYYSNHPISLSLKKAYGKALDPSRIGDMEEISGHGVVAVIDGKKVAVGNRKLMQRECGAGGQQDAVDITQRETASECRISRDGVVDITTKKPASETNDPGNTTVYISINGTYQGAIAIADMPKPTSAKAIATLRKQGIKKEVMLTGDSEAVAKAVAAALGIDEVYAGLLPGDKVEKIEALLSKKGEKETVAFVGDGINDAPVLSRADIGIAMGALGADAAIEAADVVLMDDDPMRLVTAMGIAKKCMAIVYQNIIFAIGIKALCLALGAVGIANMWVAIFADVGVMVLAVVNAVRALHYRE